MSQSSTSSEVPEEIVCDQDSHFIIELSHVNDLDTSQMKHRRNSSHCRIQSTTKKKSTNVIVKLKKSLITVTEQNWKILNTELLT